LLVLGLGEGAEVQGGIVAAAGLAGLAQGAAKEAPPLGAFGGGSGADGGVGANDGALELRPGVARQTAELVLAVGDEAQGGAAELVGGQTLVREVAIRVVDDGHGSSFRGAR
jgi:hypothetical protein